MLLLYIQILKKIFTIEQFYVKGSGRTTPEQQQTTSIRTQYYLKNTSSDILTCLQKQQREGRFCNMSSVGIPYDVIMQEFLPLLLRQRTTQGPQIYNFDWLYQDSSDFLSYISIELNDTRQATLAIPIRAFLKIFTKYLGSDN